MKILTNLLFLLILTSCTVNTVTPNPVSKKLKECICIKMWMPVCGEDHKTYGNSCEADCAGVKYQMGACEDELLKK